MTNARGTYWTITFRADDGREIVFADAEIFETKQRPASGNRDTEVEVIFFTNDYEKAKDLVRLDGQAS
jgi:hypothetical protein